MLNLLKRLFGSQNQRTLRRMSAIVDAINAREASLRQVSDEALRSKTEEFRRALADGRTLDDLLPEAFACVREAARRTIGLRHYDVQLIGGITLHEGRIAEMRTGEGKTLVSTLAAYLNALEGRGVHIVTVNDYLARRDRYWMGPVHEFLGLTVGYIQHDMENDERRRMYACDITYVTNNELGFDYLRDNMVMRTADRVLRPLNYAIVDEVDSILIDEARTPLIISGPAEESTEKYYVANRLVPRLNRKKITEDQEIKAKFSGLDIYKGYDAVVDEKNHTVVLTDSGILKCEKLLGVKNIYDDLQAEWVHHITQAIRAHDLYQRDVHYVIKDGEIVIVDEFTGRLMPGRRWSEGLHQAVEAKENLPIREENQTLATITFQNFFRMYRKISGMTGTAMTSEDEFWGVYKLGIVVIPTNKPMIRKDHPDVIYRTEKEKWIAIVNEIVECHRNGQPVLVGTRSIEKNELVSSLLRRRGIPHQVLNAKHHEREAQILAQAGRKGMVTVATNMAGRGVDIILGGKPDPEHGKQLLCTADCGVPFLHNREYHDVVALGGLRVIGTERHDARRIDNQLRGRAGRQGDPGESRFYVALNDDLMRLFGGERLSVLMERLGMKEGESIEAGIVTKSIERAQKRVENANYDMRKHLLEYDGVMNRQREQVYSLRNAILEGGDVAGRVRGMIEESVEEHLAQFCAARHPEEWQWNNLSLWLARICGETIDVSRRDLASTTREGVRDELVELLVRRCEARANELGADVFAEMQRMVLLHLIDLAWREHLYELDHLRKGIGLRSFGQKDPLIEYKKESFRLFAEMQTRIREQCIEYIFRLQPVTLQRPAQRPPMREERPDGKLVPDASRSVPGMRGGMATRRIPMGGGARVAPPLAGKIGRNDPCPCGSGKKYKKCCGG